MATDLFQIGHSMLIELDLLLDNLSKPNPNYIQDKIEYAMAHTRNKMFLKSKLFLMIFFIIDMLINGIPFSVSTLRCMALLILCFCLILSCRYHPYIFHISKTIICLAYAARIMNTPDAGIHRAWCSVFIFPIYLYAFTGSFWCLIFQAAAQLFCINIFYSKKLAEALAYMTPETYNRNLIYSTNFALVVSTLLLASMHYFMQHVYKTISLAEKKKDEIENQKIFLLGFSHELRNLINSLAGNVKLATLEVLTPKVRELLQSAELCGELLLHLVNNILDTGKVEIGELEINPVPTRIYETFEKIWGVCSELIKRKNLKGKMRIPKDLPKNLMIDHYRLTQIFLNLVGNAVKFTESGFVDISVHWLAQNEIVNENCFKPYPFNYDDDHDEGLFEKQRSLSNFDENIVGLDLVKRRVDLNMLKEPQSTKKGVLKIIVSDTGCGMSQEDAIKLFQKFTQITPDKSKRKLGTGLGLFITKQLCKRMNGDIKSFSRKGCGSAFIFCIPVDVVQENHTLASDTESLADFLKSQNLQAMIVDDVPFNHTILENFFDKLGIKVIDVANNGLEAYKKYSQQIEAGRRPHIIAMDLDMPIMDGKESARKIRQLEERMRLKPCFLFIISGNCSESEIAECLNKNGKIRAGRFMKKPVTIEEFSQALGHHFIGLQLKK